MLRSLQARLILLVALLIIAAVAAGSLMAGLFGQSASAKVREAQAELTPACTAIAEAYRGLDSSHEAALRPGLSAVVQAALEKRPGVEGGIWRRAVGSLAYAYPSYEGGAPKTDFPEAERARIGTVNQQALTEQRPVQHSYEAATETLLIDACPLPGQHGDLSTWVMTRVQPFAGRAYQQLMVGLAVLFATVLLAAALLTQLTVSWSRHVRAIELALSAHDIADLPDLPMTGERELDQIVRALNDTGTRLAQARRRAQDMSQQIATSERLAAIGRVAAGVAHEIRNPIATMRLKAENALAKGGERYPEALDLILSQITRLDRLVQRLLNVTEPERAQRSPVDVNALLTHCVAEYQAAAASRNIGLVVQSGALTAQLDAELIRRALQNLLSNALQAAPDNSRIDVAADLQNEHLVLAVRDRGAGPPGLIRERLFEPFVTGRADGTGLGLSIVREVAEAHGGSIRFETAHDGTTVFEMTLPCPAS